MACCPAHLGLPSTHSNKALTEVTTITKPAHFGQPFFSNCVTIWVEEQAMKSILNLQSDSEKGEKVEAASVPRPEDEEQKTQSPPSKRLSKFVNRAAHKGALHSSRGGSGIFTK
jgi:hypothetical protein